MKRKAKRTSLPRLTVLSMSRRELVEFTTAVEGLRHVVLRLDELVDELRARTARRPRRAPADQAEDAAAADGGG